MKCSNIIVEFQFLAQKVNFDRSAAVLKLNLMQEGGLLVISSVKKNAL